MKERGEKVYGAGKEGSVWKKVRATGAYVSKKQRRAAVRDGETSKRDAQKDPRAKSSMSKGVELLREVVGVATAS